MRKITSSSTLATELYSLPFRVKTQKHKDVTYIVGYQKARDISPDGKSRSVDVNRVQIGTLMDDGSVKLSKKFVEKFPMFKGYETESIYYLKNSLLTHKLYIDRLSEMSTKPQESEPEIQPYVSQEDASDLALGPTSIFLHLAKFFNLKSRLQVAFDNNVGRDLLTLIIGICCSERPGITTLDDFTKKNILPGSVHLTPKRITELLRIASDVSLQDRYWQQAIAALPYEKDSPFGLIIDGTSISTYSEDIKDAQRDYNKQGENLNQVNYMCMLNPLTHEVVYAKTYNGSIPDKSIYQSVLEGFKETHGGQELEVSITCDRGFITNENIEYQLRNNIKMNMCASLFQHSFIKANALDRMEEVINNAPIISDDVRGVKLPDLRYTILDKGTMIETVHLIPTYLYFNQYAYSMGWLSKKRAVDECIHQKLKYGHAEEELEKKCRAFIEKTVDENGEIQYVPKGAEIAKQAYLESCFALLCNSRNTSMQALTEYRAREMIEEFMNALKNKVGAKRMYMGDDTYRGVLFLKTLAAMLVQRLNQLLIEAADKRRIQRMYIPELLEEARTVRAVRYKGSWRKEKTIAKTRRIFEALDIPFLI